MLRIQVDLELNGSQIKSSLQGPVFDKPQVYQPTTAQASNRPKKKIKQQQQQQQQQQKRKQTNEQMHKEPRRNELEQTNRQAC